MTSRVFCIRHIERDKGRNDDPQFPTYLGEIQAYTMGLEVRRKYSPTFVSVTSSPQPRATRTAAIFLAGLAGHNVTAGIPPVDTDSRLNDFSTDKRPEVEPGLKICKRYAQATGVEVEQALFLCSASEVAKARQTKVGELLDVIDAWSTGEGDHLLALHGAAIDGACIALMKALDPNEPAEVNLGYHGGMFDKAEGFVAVYEDGILKSVETIRQPATLKAMAFMLGPL